MSARTPITVNFIVCYDQNGINLVSAGTTNQVARDQAANDLTDTFFDLNGKILPEYEGSSFADDLRAVRKMKHVSPAKWDELIRWLDLDVWEGPVMIATNDKG